MENTNNQKYFYFAYGMNTNVAGMAARCPAAKSLGGAFLRNYQFRFAGPADVVPTNNNYVDGVLWEITPECLRSLDRLEGYPDFYDRKYVTVQSGGKNVKALVYFMQPGNPDYPPTDRYFHMVEEGYREHGVPVDQLYDALEVFEEDDDEDYKTQPPF